METLILSRELAVETRLLTKSYQIQVLSVGLGLAQTSNTASDLS